MATFKDMEKVWNEWMSSHYVGDETLLKGIDLLEEIGEAYVEENGFSSISSAIGKIDSKVEFGEKALAAYQRLLDFIEKNKSN
ncbi:MAG: hypothetical protein A2301_01355 [Candidatus Magasanikbacteria bacterium RIFOXYB2_FULL_40_13]|uniref:Uncharacterized protein n=1 Tax=Candidatus Magasanikbacteria bacterium RIFOXYB1_FULL_40_15 TaxID=1798697 RepID=A0A1F6NG21_9BACT|nr:MAG: hypothetical protein A2373_00610 [Candidatus Magasanikbacteria bacterium RIFOXYB1_FULL_40_15]OGH86592.1 MAG: hypothetical protein A2301_01355 [Candidatus Magasanikbacteria bacterium RIFOXYB2_FULL_40_13]